MLMQTFSLAPLHNCSSAQEPFFLQPQEFIITPWGLSGV
ncbi:hypothetical protein GXM_08609 [Nostoc sphaeroides CCNUC1]|uniref:Uncharacterized protein n=1 Tax=Nostoc sphaeroides CCNUC1 TaxID=2653204 RepID=A0A5P8WE79_9NOSO|nr:hypothetical protein GXM_08609 [Nostoc sphaeroides CCNUC1]